MARGETWGSRCRATRVPTLMAKENGRNATPASSAEKPSTVCTKIEVKNTDPTSSPVTPSMTVVPDTSAFSLQMCGGNSGAAARRSSARNAANRTMEMVLETRACGEVQPWVPVAPRE